MSVDINRSIALHTHMEGLRDAPRPSMDENKLLAETEALLATREREQRPPCDAGGVSDKADAQLRVVKALGCSRLSRLGSFKTN